MTKTQTTATAPTTAGDLAMGLTALKAALKADEKAAAALRAELQFQYRRGLAGPCTRLAHKCENDIPIVSDALSVIRGVGYIQTTVTTGRQVIRGVGWLRNYFSPLG